MMLLVAVPIVARAAEPPRGEPEAAVPATAAAAAAPRTPVPDVAAEERAFSAELESYARRRAFTERLIAKRDAEAFEQAALRQARAASLKRELEARSLAEAEREVEEAVTLYLKKRELTRTLATPRAQPSEPAVAPAPPSPGR